MNATGQDLRYAIRTMGKNPGFSAVALIVLALGIGANSALFSVVNSVLLEPLPYPEPDRLMQIGRELPMGRSSAVSITQFVFYRDNSHTFENMATHDGQGAGINLVEGDRPESIPSIRVSSEFFGVLGANPQIGRDFAPADCEPGAEKVAIIGDGLWRRRFGADPSIIGRALRLSGKSYTVVGVMARGFDFKTHAEIWTPLTLVADAADRSAVYYIVARAKPGVTVATAQSDMDAVVGQFRSVYPDLLDEQERPFVGTLLDQVVGSTRTALLILLGAVGLVLLIACANVANLLLARATGRRREIALRAALGAGRMRIVRQLLTESALLALIGGVLGLLVARGSMALLLAMRPSNLPRLDVIRVDGAVLGFTLGVALLTGVLFGLFPAIQASRLNLHEALKEGTNRGSVGGRQGRARAALVVSEIALALVLLTGAGLLVDSFLRVVRLDPGYDYEQVLTAKMSLAGKPDLTTETFNNLVQQVVERLEASPGIEAAATISTLPLEHGLMTFFRIAGRSEPDSEANQGRAQWRLISPDYFLAMGIPLIRGRAFDHHDASDAAPVVIVNQALARRYFPDQDPVGQEFLGASPDDPPTRIVGVVGDVREITLDRPPTPTVFAPAAQAPDGITAFLANVMPTCWVVRTQGDPASFGNVLQREVLEVDPEQPLSNIRSMGQIMSTDVARRQFNTLLLTVFAGLALLLASVGIYGVMSYSVAQRTQEIGVRMALGAARTQTLGMILGQGMKLAALGVAIGVAGAFGLTRFMESMLFEVSATDPRTFVVTALALLLAAAAACLIPAARATRVDPLVALRND